MNYPWKDIFTSMPVWAISCALACDNWGFYTLLTQLPTFMNDIFKFNIEKVSLLSALPYAIMAVSLQFSGFFVDWLRKTNVFTTTQVRKICTCGACLIQSICMFCAENCKTGFGTVICLTLSAGFGSFSMAGFFVNPNTGIANTVGTIPGILSPLLTGIIVQHQSAEEWQWVFRISSGLYVFGLLFYGIFASGKLQHWAEIKTEQKNPHDDKPLV